MRPLDIAIVGYGTAGQAAALALRADGHRIVVFERAPQPGPVGAGLLLQPTGLAVLWELGLLGPALRLGRRVDRLYGDARDGRPVMDMRYSGLDPRLFGLGMQRGALFALFDQALRGHIVLQADTEIDDVAPDSGYLRDQHGARHGPFDLILAADGSASRLRSRLGAARLDAPYPWGARWCLVAEGDWPWPTELRQRYQAAERMIGMLPVGTRPDDPQPRISFFYSLPLVDFDAFDAAGLDDFHNEVIRLWPACSAWLSAVASPDQLLRASYRDVILGPSWHRQRLLCLGDAAHAMSPQLGQGVNMALMDALVLRDTLRQCDSLQAGLRAFAVARQRHVAIYQFWSRWLTPLFQSHRRAPAWLRDRLLFPMGRFGPGRALMLRVLSGTQQGWWGQLALPAGLLQALDEA